MGSTCNSLSLATPQSVFIHRWHKGFHEELLSLDLFAAWAGAGGLSHCSCLVLITKDQTEGYLTLSHCDRVPQPMKQGDGGCSDIGHGLQYGGLPCAEPIRDTAWQPVASRLQEAFFLCMLASREINPALPFFLGSASETCLSPLQGS